MGEVSYGGDVIQGRRIGGGVVSMGGLVGLDLRFWEVRVRRRSFSDSEEERSFGRGGLSVGDDILKSWLCCEE